MSVRHETPKLVWAIILSLAWTAIVVFMATVQWQSGQSLVNWSIVIFLIIETVGLCCAFLWILGADKWKGLVGISFCLMLFFALMMNLWISNISAEKYAVLDEWGDVQFDELTSNNGEFSPIGGDRIIYGISKFDVVSSLGNGKVIVTGLVKYSTSLMFKTHGAPEKYVAALSEQTRMAVSRASRDNTKICSLHDRIISELPGAKGIEWHVVVRGLIQSSDEEITNDTTLSGTAEGL